MCIKTNRNSFKSHSPCANPLLLIIRNNTDRSNFLRVEILPSDSTACAFVSFPQTQSHHTNGAFPQPIADHWPSLSRNVRRPFPQNSVRRSDLRLSCRTRRIDGSAQNRYDLNGVTCYFTQENTDNSRDVRSMNECDWLKASSKRDINVGDEQTL